MDSSLLALAAIIINHHHQSSSSIIIIMSNNNNNNNSSATTSTSSSTSTTSTVVVVVKWGKETVTLTLDLGAVGVSGLKRQLCEHTGVPVERQKIMCKAPKHLWKGVLKDDVDFRAVDWSSNSNNNNSVQLLLMGSSAGAHAKLLQGPAVKTVFLEDLRDEEKAAIAIAEPAGLVNLGNTCYLNSVLQCLRAVPALQSSLAAFIVPPSNNNNNHHPAANNHHHSAKVYFCRSLADTYRQLQRQTAAVAPAALVQAAKLAFPQFAQTGPHGQPMQQDAEEFYSGVLSLLSEQPLALPPSSAAVAASSTTSNTRNNNAIDALFGMRLKETLTCDEFSSSSTASELSNNAMPTNDDAAFSPTEPPVVSYDLHRKLVCNIQGGSDGNASSTNVTHVNEGILLGLTGTCVKHSAVLGRDAVWTRQQRIAQLPGAVLTIQFGRFYWKATPESQDHAGVKCKVMKPVAFADVLDVYDFCTPEIQTVLQRARSAALAADEAAVQRKLEGKNDDTENTEMKDAPVAPSGGAGGDKMDESQEQGADEDDEDDLQAALAMSLMPEEEDTTTDAAADAEAAAVLGPGFPRNFQGIYELFAVVTHKGRDADGGHYMAWVKSEHQQQQQSNDGTTGTGTTSTIADSNVPNEDWFVFDDDEVSPCKTEDVLKLKGGGDWHMSYLNFYRVKK